MYNMSATETVPAFHWLRVESTDTSSIYINWSLNSLYTDRLIGYKVHYQAQGEGVIKYGPLLESTEDEFGIQNLQAGTHYKVCVAVFRENIRPIHECIDASTTSWQIPVSIGSSIGAILALMIIVLVVAVARCQNTGKKGKRARGSSRYDSMGEYSTSGFNASHMEMSDTVMSDNDHCEEGHHYCKKHSFRDKPPAHCNHVNELEPGDDAANVNHIHRASFKDKRGSFRDKQGRQGSYRDRQGSFRDRQGSFRDRQGSFRDRQGSFRDRQGSFRDRQGSFRDRQGSFRDRQGSFRDRQGSFRDRQGSFRDQQGSFRRKQGSFRSNHGSFRENQHTLRDNQAPSFRDKIGSVKDLNGTIKDNHEKSGSAGDRPGILKDLHRSLGNNVRHSNINGRCETGLNGRHLHTRSAEQPIEVSSLATNCEPLTRENYTAHYIAHLQQPDPIEMKHIAKTQKWNHPDAARTLTV